MESQPVDENIPTPNPTIMSTFLVMTEMLVKRIKRKLSPGQPGNRDLIAQVDCPPEIGRCLAKIRLGKLLNTKKILKKTVIRRQLFKLLAM